MAVEYEQISDDDLNKSLLGGRAAQVTVAPNPAVAPVAEKPRTAVAPPKRSSDASSIAGASAPPVAATVDLPGLVQQVTEGTTQMQENLPKPNTQDSAQQMMDLIGKHWQVPAAIAGTAAAAAILRHIMKKDGGAGPPSSPGGLANPIEPQMDTNQQRPTEPYLESEKPTIQSRTFGSKESMVETGINNKYPFTLQDAKTALGLSNVPIKSVQDAEIVAQQYAKQLQNQSSLAAAVSTPAPSLANPSPSTTPTPVAEPISTTPVTVAQTADTTENEFLKRMEEKYGPLPSKTPAVAPELSTTSAEPITGAAIPTTAAEPVTPAEPVATTTETPATKATNEKIIETIKSTETAKSAAQSSLGKPDLVTGTGMPAYQGQGPEGSKPAHKKGVFESIKQIPKEYVFVPTGQNMDIVRNAVGQPEYTKNLKSSGGYPESPQAAYEQSRNINKSLGRATMAEAKASGIPLPEPTPSITQKIAGSKTVRVAGVTGALILASDLASAAQEGVTAVKEGDRQMATGYLTDIIGALTGPAGFTASQLFGTSPDELRTLRTAEQARKAGAGRGFAPPSAYQR